MNDMERELLIDKLRNDGFFDEITEMIDEYSTAFWGPLVDEYEGGES